MDVPSWHPANQSSDAARRQAMSGEDSASKRVTYETVDTSTEAERELVSTEDESVVLGGGRGLLDPSDRMYLVDQTHLELQARNREKMERQAALQTFRSSALKVQAHKTEIAVTTSGSGKKSPLPVEKKSVVVIKAKKRQATPSGKETTKVKKSRTTSENPTAGKEVQTKSDNLQTPSSSSSRSSSKKSSSASTTKPSTNNPATALLLQDYSSSSDEE
ncbi:hypothetical protein F441_09514 [Phytophthora nicotianae CJ01A1]|uniref:Uncharacterized protein n=3 Tax=Phytophthora nicotianae TaxID=4792 RepID=W2GSH7_PHYNI|nr:hypothetical protein L915_09377 [Phytophthora nicotianae]ETL39382.1 hypothetical protein L916_09281 [Phytophthora nicotianae]ETM45800.1 hypothetical protein L914_09238 [Phytophthora nicotianae]ETP15767.1 hypothetical protein F441_09514 [Phytophthora nicotianae CJ01A1]KUF81493.1 hypothetical protein AM587_10017272 [Phytophthora nicotianae]